MEEYLKEHNLMDDENKIRINSEMIEKLPNGIYKNYLKALNRYKEFKLKKRYEYESDYDKKQKYIIKLIKKYSLDIKHNKYKLITKEYNETGLRYNSLYSYLSINRNYILTIEYLSIDKYNKTKYYYKKINQHIGIYGIDFNFYNLYFSLKDRDNTYINEKNKKYMIYFILKNI